MTREQELEQLVRSFVLNEIEYMTRNNLGDPEKQHNVRWARQLGINDTLENLNNGNSGDRLLQGLRD